MGWRDVLRGAAGPTAVASNIAPAEIAKLMQGGWQGRAYAYYDELGEIHYAAGFHARIGKLRFYVGQIDNQGEITEVPDSSALTGLGDINAIAETWGRQRFLGGESWAIEYPGGEDTEWECLSPLELKRKNSQVELLGRPKGERMVFTRVEDEEPLGEGECHLFRLWRPHPKNRYQVDSPMRAVEDDCERLKMIRRKDISEIRSRIPAGLFAYPKRAFPLEPDQMPGETPHSLRALQEALVKPVKDVSDPNAQVPTMVGMDVQPPARLADQFFHLTFERRGDAASDSLKEERCVIAIARGLDMPVEYLTGVGAINHWGQWFIEDQLWKSHLQPLAAEFCAEWTEIYLSRLQDDPSMVIWYDETEIVAQPDRGGDAKDLFPLGAMGWEELRSSNGFKPDEGPDEEERAAIADWLSSTHGGSGQQPPAVGPGTVEQAPPQNGQATADSLAGYRAREVAGNRLVNALRKSDPALLATVIDVPRCQIAGHLGRTMAQTITGSRVPELSLLEGAGETYESWLIDSGYSPREAAVRASRVLHEVAAGLFDGTG